MNLIKYQTPDIVSPGEFWIKDSSIAMGFATQVFHPYLLDILTWLVERHGVVVTESWRPQTHPNDLHGTDPVRALDLRSWCYGPREKIREIAGEINERWTYDPKRPDMACCVVHQNRASLGIHAHVQVHPRTRKVTYV